ncbi:hypothetical protein [uncultured Desulfovibrio sp.]|uniref:hypothetical protein n=1 Tax=uncultured Desulfovibrio sp. TaxID=167968 RepID=UPI002625832D|nr:hypothetical protein [uncultured Desulfovibrio sp.]
MQPSERPSRENGAPQVHDAEILHEQPRRDQYGGGNGRAGHTIRFIQFRQSAGFGPGPSEGCLAPAITFGLFLGCLVQLGILVAIGFVVFWCIGAVLGAVLQVRRTLNRQPTNPWIWRIANWLVCLMLVSWLADGRL